MASEKRRGKNERSNYRPLNYFYLDGKITGDGPTIPLLHKKLHINVSANVITAWCYPLGKRVAYTYSDVKLRKGPAFTTKEVQKLLDRGRTTIERAIDTGAIEPPQMTYGINAERRPYKYMWSEKDVIALHEYMLTVHYGRPRHDGLIAPKALPTMRELRALMRNEELLYIKDGDEFKPVWRAR